MAKVSSSTLNFTQAIHKTSFFSPAPNAGHFFSEHQNRILLATLAISYIITTMIIGWCV